MTSQQKFNNWLNDIIETEKPGNDILAYWFGIYESTGGYEIYLIGSKVFDDNNDDWASNVDFAPQNKYLSLGQNGVSWGVILEEVKNI